jgi:hypothetical protein
VVHADTEDPLAALVRQGIVEGQLHGAARQQRRDELEHDEPHLVERPARRREDAVERRMVLLSCHAGGHERSCDRTARGEEPARQDRDERAETRGAHRPVEGLDEGEERRYESHDEPPVPEVVAALAVPARLVLFEQPFDVDSRAADLHEVARSMRTNCET